jgi:signal transduction histidine kinase
LWQASKLATMGELAASIAHELNNPLATVSLRTESLLERLPESDPNRAPLEVISQEVDRMATLVNNLLEFSRRRYRQVSTVDVRAEISNSIEFVHYHLRNRRIEVVSQFAPDVPGIQADRQQLRQLFLNLLTNASDAMPQGGTLTLRVDPMITGSEANAVVIEFADTGEGIAPDNLNKIWEPFFTTKPEGRGTGLGLAICRRIVEEHGGSIDVESEIARGTTVRIVFPATSNGAAANLI